MDHKEAKDQSTKERSEGEVADVVRRILAGEEQVISHVGVSQYAPGGVGASACGIAALNSVRVVFGKEREGVQNEALLKDILHRHTIEEITAICAQWSSDFHLEVDEIRRVPLFERSLKLVSTRYSRPTIKVFRRLLQELQSDSLSDISAALVITRPPEILTCFKIVTSTKPVYIIFDSHPRPKHLDGAGFIFNTSMDATATYLHGLFAVDTRLLMDSSMQWQAQLLANFSGHIFVSRDSNSNLSDLMQTVLESSMTILNLQAKAAGVERRNKLLESENKRLEEEIEEIEMVHLKEMKQLQSVNASRSWNPFQVPGPSNSVPFHASHDDQHFSLSMSSASHHDEQYSFQPNDRDHSRSNDKGKAPVYANLDSDNDDDDYKFAMQMDGDLDHADRLSVEEAVRQQRKFEDEDRRLRKEREMLVKSAPVLFTCGVCLEEMAEDFVTHIDCGHRFCRECVRGYIVTKLKEHRYPILCPCCVAEKSAHDPGVINDTLIREVGVLDEDYRIFEEMQLAAFSVLLHCRKCKQSVFVDRTEYQEQKVLVCPLPGCGYAWCKACQQAIPMGGPPHSCDGSSELVHLMKQKGWKHCPGCQTPILKESGCNHMTCMSPGCNTHFCYICGKLIVQSSLPRQITAATSAHFRKCRLFEDVV